LKTAAILAKGEKGIIDKFLDESLSVKCIEMGCLPGYPIKLIRKAPLGSPIYFKIGKNYLALRREEAINVVLK